MIDFLSKLPTTQGQALVSWILWFSTALRYLASHDSVLGNGTISPHWSPSYEWLGALLVLSGVSGAQFFAKRVTDHTYVAAKKAP
jgi:hypothetical protein